MKPKPLLDFGKCSPMQATPSLSITLQSLGHVPSFKNKKRVFTNKKIGKSFIGTRGDVKQWMEKAIRNIELQLRSHFLTTVGVTSTERLQPSLIASSVPLDDSRQWISELRILAVETNAGEENHEIIIERIK